MNVLIVDNETTYISQLERLFIHHNYQTVPFGYLEEVKADTFDLIVLSGGHSQSIQGHDKTYMVELDLIRNSTIPVLGICLGFELIAYAFGSSLRELEEKERGMLPITVDVNDPIFGGVSTFDGYEMHRWVVSSLGEDLVGLAHSKDGYEVIRHKTKPIYGFQFHPEMLEDDAIGRTIMTRTVGLFN